MGKKAWEPSEKDLEKIAQLSADGLTESNIAQHIGISPSCYFKKKLTHPEIQEAIDNATKYRVDFAKGKLWKIVMNEDHKSHFQAVVWFLNKYDGDPQESKTEDLVSGFNFTVINNAN